MLQKAFLIFLPLFPNLEIFPVFPVFLGKKMRTIWKRTYSIRTTLIGQRKENKHPSNGMQLQQFQYENHIYQYAYEEIINDEILAWER